MSRLFLNASLLVIIAVMAGCGEQVKDDPRYQVDPGEAQIAISQGYNVPNASEVDLVERMAASRADYRETLDILVGYYKTTGDAVKSKWAEHELDSLIQYHYLMPAEVGHAGLRATDPIDSADMLYEDGKKLYEDAGGLVIITDDEKMRAALNKFNQVISNYPTSDKIDDAAYKAGRIYSHFGDYGIAAVYYQRTFQWDNSTPYPARFRAAHTLDQKLKMKHEALSLYRLAIEKESRYEANTQFAARRIRQLVKPVEVEEEVEAQETDAE
jgi:TolA-binding protein